jgi:hypothetical protein
MHDEIKNQMLSQYPVKSQFYPNFIAIQGDIFPAHGIMPFRSLGNNGSNYPGSCAGTA